MRIGKLLFCAVLLFGVGLSQAARAEQRHDWFLAAGEDGTFLNATVFFPGVQTGVEHRESFYGMANQLTLRGTGILTYPMTDAQIDVNVRVLVVTAGLSVGGRDSFRNMTFEPDEPMDRKRRRDRWAAGDFDTAAWPHAEARLELALPFNDYLLFNCVNTARFEDRPNRSYDWRNGLVHDNGMLYKSESMLFVKHRSVGGLAPMITFLDFGLDDERHTMVLYGFTFLSRTGITRWNDQIAIQMHFYGEMLDGFKYSDVYGADMWRGPWNIMVAYMSIIPL